MNRYVYYRTCYRVGYYHSLPLKKFWNGIIILPVYIPFATLKTPFAIQSFSSVDPHQLSFINPLSSHAIETNVSEAPMALSHGQEGGAGGQEGRKDPRSGSASMSHEMKN